MTSINLNAQFLTDSKAVELVKKNFGLKVEKNQCIMKLFQKVLQDVCFKLTQETASELEKHVEVIKTLKVLAEILWPTLTSYSFATYLNLAFGSLDVKSCLQIYLKLINNLLPMNQVAYLNFTVYLQYKFFAGITRLQA